MTDITKPELSKKDKVAKGVAVTLFGLVGIIFLAAIFGHGGDAKPPTSSPDATSAPPTASADVAAAPEPPSHAWSYREGREYGYPAAISDDDRKAGAAASEVMMYRYLGERRGIYTVQAVRNGVTATASCANPCEVVKLSLAGMTQRMTFNPESIVGEALTDAMNGQMEVYSHPAGATSDEGE